MILNVQWLGWGGSALEWAGGGGEEEEGQEDL